MDILALVGKLVLKQVEKITITVVGDFVAPLELLDHNVKLQPTKFPYQNLESLVQWQRTKNQGSAERALEPFRDFDYNTLTGDQQPLVKGCTHAVMSLFF